MMRCRDGCTQVKGGYLIGQKDVLTEKWERTSAPILILFVGVFWLFWPAFLLPRAPWPLLGHRGCSAS